MHLLQVKCTIYDGSLWEIRDFLIFGFIGGGNRFLNSNLGSVGSGQRGNWQKPFCAQHAGASLRKRPPFWRIIDSSNCRRITKIALRF